MLKWLRAALRRWLGVSALEARVDGDVVQPLPLRDARPPAPTVLEVRRGDVVCVTGVGGHVQAERFGQHVRDALLHSLRPGGLGIAVATLPLGGTVTLLRPEGSSHAAPVVRTGWPELGPWRPAHAAGEAERLGWDQGLGDATQGYADPAEQQAYDRGRHLRRVFEGLD